MSADVVAEARARAAAEGRELDFQVRAVEEMDPDRDSAELIVCCEVLEHVEDADRVLGILARLASPWLLVSVPREPVWRILNMARGKYISDLGNTPGHLNHFSARGIRGLLAERIDVVAVERPLPWTMVLGRVRT